MGARAYITAGQKTLFWVILQKQMARVVEECCPGDRFNHRRLGEFSVYILVCNTPCCLPIEV